MPSPKYANLNFIMMTISMIGYPVDSPSFYLCYLLLSSQRNNMSVIRSLVLLQHNLPVRHRSLLQVNIGWGRLIKKIFFFNRTERREEKVVCSLIYQSNEMTAGNNKTISISNHFANTSSRTREKHVQDGSQPFLTFSRLGSHVEYANYICWISNTYYLSLIHIWRCRRRG